MRQKATGVAVVIMTIVSALMCGSAYGGEAVRVFLEVSSDTATPWPTVQNSDYLRCRAVFLDAGNDLATTFGSTPDITSIADAQLVLQSAYGTQVRFSSQPATDTDLTAEDWLPAASEVTLEPGKAWQEFAVSYDAVSATGMDAVTVTLKQGTWQLSAQTIITVKAPLANCYVVRTGGGLSKVVNGVQVPLASVLSVLPAQQANLGKLRYSGDETTFDVFAALYHPDDHKYYYTDNVPPGAEIVKVDGLTLTLVDGFVHSSNPKTVKIGIEDNAEKVNSAYTTGVQKSYSAEIADKTVSRLIGARSGDVNGGETLNASGNSVFGVGVGDGTNQDTANYIPESAVDKITIVGLAINEIPSEITSTRYHKVSTLVERHQSFFDPATLKNAKLGMKDVTVFADPTVKPTPDFRVPGIEGQTGIFGAIVATNSEGSLVPFASELVTFHLRKAGGAAVNNDGLELEPLTDWTLFGSFAGNNQLTVSNTYQCIMPFVIRAKNVTADGSTAAINDLYIEKITLASGGTLSSTLFAGVDSEAEGVDFIAQDTIGAVTLTGLLDMNGKYAGADGKVIVHGSANESSFELRMLDSVGGPVKIAQKGSVTPNDATVPVLIPPRADNIAEQDVAVFTAGETKYFCLFKGLDKATRFLQMFPYFSDDVPGIKVRAANPDDYEPVSITSKLNEINVVLDREYAHDQVVLADGLVQVTDIYSNAAPASGTFLDDMDIKADVFLPDADGGASDIAFPGASVDIEPQTIEVDLDVRKITAEQDTGILKVVSKGGTVSTEVTMNFKAVSAVGQQAMFIPIPGITDTPVEVFMADQNGAMVSPVTVTTANSPGGGSDTSDGNRILVDLSSDNGSLSGTSDGRVALWTTRPRGVVSVRPDGTATRVTLGAESTGYDDGELVITFEPDFTQPFVADIDTGSCRVAIEIVDNTAVDLAGSTVTVIDSSGNDITTTLVRSEEISADGSSGWIILRGFPAATDDYTATITAVDPWGNERTVPRTFTVACADPECLLVDPAYGVRGATVTVTIEAQDTHFTEGETPVVTFSCEDNATVSSVRVIDDETLEVDVVISGTSEPSSSTEAPVPSNPEENTALAITTAVPSISAQASGDDVPVDDGDGDDDGAVIVDDGIDVSCNVGVSHVIDGDLTETLLCENAFTVTTEPVAAKCVSIAPQSVQAGEDAQIVISAEGTGFSEITEVNFDCDAINIISTTVNSSNQMTVNISSDPLAATETCSVVIDDVLEQLSCGELTVAGTPPECQLVKISRPIVSKGFMVPRFYIVTITGNGQCRFEKNPVVDFGNEDIQAYVLPFLSNSRRVTCFVKINPGTASWTYSVTVDGNNGVTFTIR